MPVLNGLLGKFCVLAACCSAILAAPLAESSVEYGTDYDKSQLSTRASGTRNDPKDAFFNIAGWENIAEEDCFAMLCLMGGNRVYQRVSTANGGDPHRTESGANLTPFQSNQLATRHTSQITPQTISAEEFPFASTQQGGVGAILFPATLAEQNQQKNAISAAYRRTGGPGYNEWFKITFNGAPLGKFCRALHADPQDFSVCGNSVQSTLFGIAGVILADFAYQLVNTQGRPFFFHHAAGSRKGTRGLELNTTVPLLTGDDS
ncbi:hypothetical protein GQX73_g10109 [Xylaria multiplex]|uniref:Deoxyribonuclease NucA/NucB domain-containing protein n=1 Tax=Xylaria multiplex TaxID=323545 RepID=A0A7C8ILL8_9PEZI|nr:hypothetical protein GQX73_g10109 [Xylaria multiplex]